ncbi:SCO family protein [Methylocystis heyeri]|uniref:SCO family protein n=1 Tax=Methylocystis heyeri TaxID=391905 RepID=A0A6B8KC59_9HYPH|nr:SCO family protein [Methylocystis heyeri]QGM45796.1 SCO family protein [Methylocystis heyeri]
MQALLFILAMCAALSSASADSPRAPAAIAFEQKPGARLPLEARLRDQNDVSLRVSDLFEGKPLILALGYFRCKSFCPVLRADLLETLRRSDLEAGRDYSLAFVSIDPSETPSDAREAKDADIMRWPAPGAERWRFLTSDAASLRALADSVGFRVSFDEKKVRFVHPVGVVFITRDGRVSNYLTGVGYDPIGVRGALARASAEVIAGKQSLINLLCYEYDASTGGYTLAVTRLLRGGAILTIGLLGAMIYRSMRGEVPRA